MANCVLYVLCFGGRVFGAFGAPQERSYHKRFSSMMVLHEERTNVIVEIFVANI